MFLSSFSESKTAELERLRESTDLVHLRSELAKTEKSYPDCALESLYRTNKLNVLLTRISELTKK